MSVHPKISVVILNWNRPEETLEAVRSTLKQDYPDLEIIVWDNASTDQSKEVLTAAFGAAPRVRFIWSTTNCGVAGGRNQAFAEAKGDLLFSLDSDAVIETRDGLQHMANLFIAEPDVGAISFEVRRPDGHLMWPFSRPAADWRESRFDTYRVDGCSFGTRRTLFNQIGGFAEHFSPYGAEDQYYALQVLAADYRVVYLPDVKVIHAFTPGGRQGRQFAMHVRNMLRLPLELFPFPAHWLHFAARARNLYYEGRELGQLDFFKEGLSAALKMQGHRHPMSQSAWRTWRRLVHEDKTA